MTRQSLEDRLTRVDGRRLGPDLAIVRVGPRAEAERSHEGLDSAAHRRVGDAELALDVAEVSAGPKEALEQRHLVAAQPGEPPDGELAFERRPAGGAAETGDRQLTGADGARGDDVVSHVVLDARGSFGDNLDGGAEDCQYRLSLY